MQEELVKLKGYTLNELQIVRNIKKNSKKDDDEGDLELKSKFFQNDKNKNMYKVTMDITVITNTHNIIMSLEGYFEFDSAIDQPTREIFLEINAPTILYPYCRSFISMISSFDTESSIILPVINFAEKH